jgi:hypothetical protein
MRTLDTPPPVPVIRTCNAIPPALPAPADDDSDESGRATIGDNEITTYHGFSTSSSSFLNTMDGEENSAGQYPATEEAVLDNDSSTDGLCSMVVTDLITELLEPASSADHRVFKTAELDLKLQKKLRDYSWSLDTAATMKPAAWTLLLSNLGNLGVVVEASELAITIRTPDPISTLMAFVITATAFIIPTMIFSPKARRILTVLTFQAGAIFWKILAYLLQLAVPTPEDNEIPRINLCETCELPYTGPYPDCMFCNASPSYHHGRCCQYNIPTTHREAFRRARRNAGQGNLVYPDRSTLQSTSEQSTQPEALNTSLTMGTTTNPTASSSQPSYVNPGSSSALSRGKAAWKPLPAKCFKQRQSGTISATSSNESRVNEPHVYNLAADDNDSLSSFDIVGS